MSSVTNLSPTAIVTFTGRVVEPLNPDPETISIVDIAHSLSNQCRFTGHTKLFYSVAEHSVRVSRMVPDKDALWGLLHDASEAYLADLARPIKRSLGSLAEAYSEAEQRLMDAIATKFNLDLDFYALPYALPPSVKKADNEILKVEMRELMPPNCSDDIEIKDLVVDQDEEGFEPWSPRNARQIFLMTFAELTDNDMMID